MFTPLPVIGSGSNRAPSHCHPNSTSLEIPVQTEVQSSSDWLWKPSSPLESTDLFAMAFFRLGIEIQWNHTLTPYTHKRIHVETFYYCTKLCKNILYENLLDFFASTLSFSIMTQFLTMEFTSRSLPEHPLQSKLAPFDRQIKHLWFPW